MWVSQAFASFSQGFSQAIKRLGFASFRKVFARLVRKLSFLLEYVWDTQSLARLYTFDASGRHLTPHAQWHGLLLQGIQPYSMKFLALRHEVWNSRNYWHFRSQAFRKLFPSMNCRSFGLRLQCSAPAMSRQSLTVRNSDKRSLTHSLFNVAHYESHDGSQCSLIWISQAFASFSQG